MEAVAKNNKMSELIYTDANIPQSNPIDTKNAAVNATNKILQLQSKTLKKVSKLETRLTAMEGTLENILKVLSNGTGNITENLLPVDIMPDDMIISDIELKLIDSISELDDFEIKLENSEFRKKSVRFIRFQWSCIWI